MNVVRRKTQSLTYASPRLKYTFSCLTSTCFFNDNCGNLVTHLDIILELMIFSVLLIFLLSFLLIF